jgi:hypothetical protein
MICKTPGTLDTHAAIDSGTYQLNLVGNADHATYETAIRSIQYSNSSSNPDLTPRNLTITVNDSKDDSIPVIRVIDIQAIDDPPHVVESMQDITIDEDAEVTVIPLNKVFSDVDNSDEDIEKTVRADYDNSIVSAKIVDNLLHLKVLQNQHGNTDITVIAASNQASVQDTFSLVVRPVNDPPEILFIPDQMIAEDGQFAKITLDNCVDDPDNTDDQMIWSVSGQSALDVTVNNRIASISPKDAEWNGVRFAKTSGANEKYIVGQRFQFVDKSGFVYIKLVLFNDFSIIGVAIRYFFDLHF